MKKPHYNYGIYHIPTKSFLTNGFMENAHQARKYIEKNLGSSKAFTIIQKNRTK